MLGTGMVGRALAEGFVRTGHDVSLGTRDVHADYGPPLDGTPASFAEWLADGASVALADFASVAGAAEVVVNATNGSATSTSSLGRRPEPGRQGAARRLEPPFGLLAQGSPPP